LTERKLCAKCESVFGRQSSSGVEQRTHKPLVAGSIPASGTSLRSTISKNISSKNSNFTFFYADKIAIVRRAAIFISIIP
jgi:hypothetical protein